MEIRFNAFLVLRLSLFRLVVTSLRNYKVHLSQTIIYFRSKQYNIYIYCLTVILTIAKTEQH